MNPITKNHPVFLRLVEVIVKNAAHPGETFTQSCAEKYDCLSALYRIKFDLVLKRYKYFSLPVIS